MVYAEEDEYEWTYEFEEFDDDCLVLSPQKQEMYMLNALTASYSSGITTYDNYMEIYYDNLTENLGKNYQGSCGYVAIGMLLSYYDTYMNDGIIPDAYDVQGEGIGNNLIAWRDSPGVLKDVIDNGYNLSASDYYGIMKSQSGYSLHAKLITIGHLWGYYNYFSNNPAGTTFGMIVAVLQSYLRLYRGYSDTDYSLDYAYELIASEDNSVRDFVIENIQSGKPVLLGVQGIDPNSNQKEGHVVIAYDYDETTDQIYCHFGWGANKTHVTPESEGLTLYKAALALNFYLPYSHAYNYIENKGQANEKSYCSCYFSCHPEHECQYYINYNNNYHKYVCGCSEELFAHNFVCDGTENGVHYVKCSDCEYRANKIENPEYTSLNSTQHEVSCPDCDYTETLEHNLVYESLGNNTHGVHCTDCGYVSSSSSHVFVYTPMLGNRHKKSCLCGYSVTESCIGRALIDGTSYCMNCGEEMDAFPEFFSIDDEEALLLGIVADLPPDNKEDEYYTE